MIVPDLFPGPSNFTEEDYEVFLDEISKDKPLTKKKRLEKYRENIKTLFEGYSVEFLKGLDYDRYNSWTQAMDDSVFIAEHLGKEKVNPKVIEYFDDATRPTAYQLSQILFAIYCPKEMVKNLPEYLWFCEKVFECDCVESHRIEKVKIIDVGHPLLNEIYNYFYQIYIRDTNEYFRLHKHIRIISTVLSYLHLNNIFDIRLFDQFIKNIDNMTIKVPINDNEYKYVKVSEFEHEWGNGSQPYEQEIYKYMFNNMDIGFTTQKQLIR